MARILTNNDPGYEFSLLDSSVSVSDPAHLGTVLELRWLVSLVRRDGIDRFGGSPALIPFIRKSQPPAGPSFVRLVSKNAAVVKSGDGAYDSIST